MSVVFSGIYFYFDVYNFGHMRFFASDVLNLTRSLRRAEAKNVRRRQLAFFVFPHNILLTFTYTSLKCSKYEITRKSYKDATLVANVLTIATTARPGRIHPGTTISLLALLGGVKFPIRVSLCIGIFSPSDLSAAISRSVKKAHSFAQLAFG